MADIHHTADAVAAAASKATTTAYTTGGGVTLYGLLTQVDWMSVIGATVLIGTFFVNWYYKHKHYQLEKLKTHSKLNGANSKLDQIYEDN